MATNKQLYEKLVEAQVSLAGSMKGINDNLRALNDQNILHAATSTGEHKLFGESLAMFTKQYWWVLIAAIIGLVAVAGYPEIARLFI